MRKRTLILVFFLFSFIGSYASHLMGGEITWECNGSGQFIFNMKIYRDCNGIPGPSGISLTVHNCSSLTSIAMNDITQTDISPQCNGAGPTVTCAGATGSTAGAVEEFVYQSNPITISGTPPAAGWIFTYTDCCRNAAITNLTGASGYGFTLRAKMYAYNAQNMNPCYDNSPVFAERPATIICTGYPFTYNHNAYDIELDSLVYSWDKPLDQLTGSFTNSNPAAVPFASGYSTTNPLPSTTQNASNVAATLNSSTGEIAFTSFTAGNFVTVIKVQAYKCGTLVAEIYREIQVVLLSCGANNPPNVTPPFKDPSTGLYTLFADTVYAGALVTFDLSSTDFELLPDGNPQTCYIDASGSQFGTGFSSTVSGCLNPPCATLNPAPPTSAQFGVATKFSWQTTCDHLFHSTQCSMVSNTYIFVIKTRDDYCPAPAINIATIAITILPPPVVPPPDLRCVSVATNGDVTLNWIIPKDTANTYVAYFVYASSNPAGPYTAVDSIYNYNQTTYTHVGANANSVPMYYYVQTRSTCFWQFSQPTDTLQAIKLDVTNPNNGTAALSWNAIHTPNLASSSGWYMIYREYPASVWTFVDSTQNLSYADPVTVCNDSVHYKIEITDASGCTSVSSRDGDLFQDILPPNIPVFDSVSVDPGTAIVTIGWNVNPATDTKCYTIYQYVGGIWDSMTTVCGINNTFLLTNILATSADSFRVVAFDSCGNTSPFGLPHNNMYLTVVLNTCLSQAILDWNDYINWPGGVKNYNIYASENGGLSVLIGSVSGTTTDFAHTPLNKFSTYCYTIQAVDTSGELTSTSNKVCIYADVPQPPKFLYVRTATVSGENQVRVDGHLDIAADVISYKILRSLSSSGPYDTIAVVTAIAGNPKMSYTDYTPQTNVTSYYYKLVAVDSCGADAFTSNIGRTIYLTAEPNSDLTNTLTWNDYEAWSGGVNSYNIYRSVNDVWEVTPFTNVLFGTNSFIDSIDDFISSDGKFCYYVQGLEGAGNIYGFSDTSLSNIACAIQAPRLYSPNAFLPGSQIPENKIFYPINAFIDVTSYHFFVYNRWGTLIFETTNRADGWNGTYQGEDVPEGVYAYVVKLTGTNGKPVERKGTITLLR